MSKRKKVLMAVGVIVILIGIPLIAWGVLRYSGYRSLYNKWTGKKPAIPSSEVQTETGWEEGWVRYEGKVYEYNDHILNFLVMGTDNEQEITEEGTGAGGQSDSNFLIVVNPDRKLVQILCINRDTIMDVDVYGPTGEYFYTDKMQLALQHSYGANRTENAEHMVTAVSRFLYGLPIHGYCSINMSAISKINDAVGSVTLECSEDLTALDRSYTQGSIITLRGERAFEYIRYRDEAVFESSRSRLERQKEYLGAFVEQAKSAVARNPAMAVNLYNSLTKEMATDITVDKVTYLVSTILDYSFDLENVMTIEGETLMGEEYEEFYPDEENMRKLMIEMFYREVTQ